MVAMSVLHIQLIEAYCLLDSLCHFNLLCFLSVEEAKSKKKNSKPLAYVDTNMTQPFVLSNLCRQKD